MVTASLTRQLRRTPTSIALTIGILCGFIFGRLLPWTRVGYDFDIPITAHKYNTISHRLQRLPGGVVIYHPNLINKLDNLSEYLRLTNGRGSSTSYQLFLPIIPESAQETLNHYIHSKRWSATHL